jgi:hypothetical protein
MIRSTTQPKRPIVVRSAGGAHGLQQGSNAARAVGRRGSERSTCGKISAGPLEREARFQIAQNFDRYGEVSPIERLERLQDKANFVRASLRLQEVVCTLFSAARSCPTSEGRRRFFFVSSLQSMCRETAVRRCYARVRKFNRRVDRCSECAVTVSISRLAADSGRSSRVRRALGDLLPACDERTGPAPPRQASR